MKCHDVPVPILANKKNIEKLKNHHCHKVDQMKKFYEYKWVDFNGKVCNTNDYFPEYSYLIESTTVGNNNKRPNNSTSQTSFSSSSNKRKWDNASNKNKRETICN